ncbi:hypothetical protein E2C01_036831 [Portunus trituberculatus]|uniref:Uncharacterized protein n=1 Tax=Portunus trituberculatus TaxID=210409 RepID=A0A5B7F6H2_PORTR|nr:hypothetical protein [Portunus trituberculatus]
MVVTESAKHPRVEVPARQHALRGTPTWQLLEWRGGCRRSIPEALPSSPALPSRQRVRFPGDGGCAGHIVGDDTPRLVT